MGTKLKGNLHAMGRLPLLIEWFNKEKPKVRPRLLAALLAASAAGGPLGGQPFLLGLGAEEPAVLQFPQNP